MITAILTMAFTWCLFYGRIPQVYLVSLCIILGAILAYLGRHKHTHFLSIDVLAGRSRLKEVNATLKFLTLFALIVISVTSRTYAAGVFLMFMALVSAVFFGGLKLRSYVHIIALPASFLLIGGLALLFIITPGPIGILNFNILGQWFCISENTQARTALVVARAFGAVSCLTFLSVTTPMPEIINVLRRARCPDLIIDLMYLIYRYIFILLSLHYEMYVAAKSRLGFNGYRTSLRTTGKIYANLLVQSYQFASKNFDAMESRCYDIGIRFLERRNRVTYPQVIVSAVILAFSLYLSLLI